MERFGGDLKLRNVKLLLMPKLNLFSPAAVLIFLKENTVQNRIKNRIDFFNIYEISKSYFLKLEMHLLEPSGAFSK